MRIGDSNKKAVSRLYRKHSQNVDGDTGLEKAKSSTTGGSDDSGGKASKAGAPAGAGGNDGIRLGLEARKYEVAAEAVARVPDIRPEKAARIEELKAMIANGTYKVDADELAKRLLSSGLFDDLA